MKVYKSKEDTLCIQGKEMIKFEVEVKSKNKELLEAIEKTAKYFNSEKTLEKINTRKVILKLENAI